MTQDGSFNDFMFKEKENGTNNYSYNLRGAKQ